MTLPRTKIVMNVFICGIVLSSYAPSIIQSYNQITHVQRVYAQDNNVTNIDGNNFSKYFTNSGTASYDSSSNTTILTNAAKQQGGTLLNSKIDMTKDFSISGYIDGGVFGSGGVAISLFNGNKIPTKSDARGLGIASANGVFGWKLDTNYDAPYWDHFSQDGSSQEDVDKQGQEKVDNGSITMAYDVDALGGHQSDDRSITPGPTVSNTQAFAGFFNKQDNVKLTDPLYYHSTTVNGLVSDYIGNDAPMVNVENPSNSNQPFTMKYDSKTTTISVTYDNKTWTKDISSWLKSKSLSFAITGATVDAGSNQSVKIDSMSYSKAPTVNVKYINQNGDTISSDSFADYPNGQESGQQYSIIPKQIADYTYDEELTKNLSTNTDGLTGTLNGQKTITLVYKQTKPSTMGIRYVDTYGNQIATDGEATYTSKLTGKSTTNPVIGDSYASPLRDIKDYTYDGEATNNTSEHSLYGTLKKAGANGYVTEVYRHNAGSYITVKIEDENGQPITQDIDGKPIDIDSIIKYTDVDNNGNSHNIGDAWSITTPLIHGYSYDGTGTENKSEIALNGKFTSDGNQGTYTIVYARNSPSFITVEYQDEDGNILKTGTPRYTDPQPDTQETGGHYQTDFAEIEGYEYDGTATNRRTPIPLNGIMSQPGDNDKVIYIYKKSDIPSIYVSYVDQDGNPIGPEHTNANYPSGQIIGNSYVTNIPEIKGYHYSADLTNHKTSNPLIGTLSKYGTQFVTVVYTKDSDNQLTKTVNRTIHVVDEDYPNDNIHDDIKLSTEATMTTDAVSGKVTSKPNTTISADSYNTIEKLGLDSDVYTIDSKKSMNALSDLAVNYDSNDTTQTLYVKSKRVLMIEAVDQSTGKIILDKKIDTNQLYDTDSINGTKKLSDYAPNDNHVGHLTLNKSLEEYVFAAGDSTGGIQARYNADTNTVDYIDGSNTENILSINLWQNSLLTPANFKLDNTTVGNLNTKVEGTSPLAFRKVSGSKLQISLSDNGPIQEINMTDIPSTVDFAYTMNTQMVTTKNISVNMDINHSNSNVDLGDDLGMGGTYIINTQNAKPGTSKISMSKAGTYTQTVTYTISNEP